MVKNDLQFLFPHLPANWVPQTGGADATKRAVWWYPGRRNHTPLPTAFYGCTQLSFPDPEPVTPVTPCMIHWLGIDIDLDEPLPASTLAQLTVIPDLHDPASFLPLSVRRSSGGIGLHLILRLVDPIPTVYQSSQAIIKALLAPVVKQIEELGVKVCSADRRMFWLWGGKNEWLVKQTRFWFPKVTGGHLPVTSPQLPVSSEKLDESNFPSALVPFLSRAIAAGVFRAPVKHSNLIHVGTFIRFLQVEGIKPPPTRSTCSPEWHVNGFLDIQGTQVTLYSFADSKVIWSFEPVDSVIETLKGFA